MGADSDSGTLPFGRDTSVSGSSRGVSELPREEQSIYNEATAFEGAAIVSMIERPAEKEGEVEKALEITMEDGITLTVELDSGEKRLIELGYKQELKRVLNAGQLYCVAISTMSVFAGVVPTYGLGFANGGPVALVWYWWISVFFVHLVGLSFAEISSSFPTAGSLYFWAAALAGPRLAPIASFFTGWLEFIGISVGLSGVAYAGVHGILAPLIFMSTGYELSKYWILGMAFATTIICAIINLFPIMVVANVMVVSAVWQIVGGIVVIILVPLVAPTLQPASWVFGYHENLAPTPSDAYSFIIALIVSQYSLYGYDGVAHLAEETKQSDRTGPMAIMASISTISLLGWGLIVSATFSIQNSEFMNATNAPGAPYLQILWDVFYGRYGSGTGAQILTFVIYGSFFFGCIAGLIGASRVCFSLARDDGFPLSFLWRKVSRTTGVPVNAVILSISIGMAFLLPLLANPVIYYGINSIASIGWVGAYATPIFFRLIQKESEFCPGPFYMADYIGVVGGKIVHFVAFLWVLYTVVAFCLPTTFPITGEDWENNFNWAPVAIISCLILLTVWWVLDARFWFRGPLKAQHLGDDLDATEGDVHKENVEVDFFES